MAKRWILVVEDDPLMMRLLEEVLQGPDIRVTTAEDAQQCFVQARDLKPALIVSDIRMPGGWTGDAALRELRKDPRVPRIPFIFVTSMKLEEASKLLPPDDPTVRLMLKPLDLDKLRQLATELTGLTLAKPGGP